MNYENFAKQLALKVGKIIRENFTLDMKKDWKLDQSVLTATDMEVNELVIKEIRKKFPDHNIQGEEKSDMGRESEYLWVLDPIDGTLCFSHGSPTFTFLLALVKDGQGILGLAYDPMLDRMFFAEKGKGAFLNDEAIKVSEIDSMEKSAVINIEAFEGAKYSVWDLCKNLDDRGANICIMMSLGYSGGLVACGEFAAAVFPNNTSHDVAALKIIVEEAGGKVTDMFGNEQRYDEPINGAIISNGRVHDEIVKTIKDLGIKDKK
jgi:fructose-1,6-bisphosphatase/inositol monophosphatase family enzyme